MNTHTRFPEPQQQSGQTSDRSGTEAMELVRIVLDVQPHETLGDAAQRAVTAFLHAPAESQDEAVVERACVAVALRLDRDPPRLLKWVHVFEAAELAHQVLERAAARAAREVSK